MSKRRRLSATRESVSSMSSKVTSKRPSVVSTGSLKFAKESSKPAQEIRKAKPISS